MQKLYYFKRSLFPKQYLMQAGVSVCFRESLPEKLCVSAATVAKDLDFLFSMFWLLTVGQVKAALCLKSCWVGRNPPLLLPKFVYGSIPFCRIVSNWRVGTWVNSQHRQGLWIVSVNEFSPSLTPALWNRAFSSAFTPLLLERGSAVTDDVGKREQLPYWRSPLCSPSFLALLSTFTARLSYSPHRVIYMLCDSAAFWGMAACLPEKLCGATRVISSLK